MKTYVMTDIHGRFDLLIKALEMIGTEHCSIIFLGDYIDRGPDSYKVVQRLKDGGLIGQMWTCLKGNHEDMAVAAGGPGAHAADHWIANGGGATVDSYYSEHGDDVQMASAALQVDAAWMNALPTMCQDEHRVYVHAQASGAEHVRLWGRWDSAPDALWRGKHVVHGHTPCDQPTTCQNRTNLDVGAFFTGRLAVGVFDDTLPGGPVEVRYVTA